MTQFLTSLFAKNIKHATYFKTANQQHQQNHVNELSCTNIYALVCFLRKKYMRFLFYGTRCKIIQSVHKTGKTAILRDFSEHGKTQEILYNLRKHCNKVLLVRHSNICVKTGVDWVNRIIMISGSSVPAQ